MKLLCIDTSTRVLSLAVSDNDRVLRSSHVSLEGFLSSSIIPSIQKILKSARIKLEALDGFAVGLGPGSFTSLRVGLATIKGLSFATGKPVVGIPSLDILAMSVLGDQQICTIMDARRNMVYACLYQKKGTTLKRKSPYLLTPLNDLLKFLKTTENITFIGDAASLFKAHINHPKKNFIFADSNIHYPQAKFLAPLVLKRFKEKKFDEVEKIVPLYLYRQDCQVQK